MPAVEYFLHNLRTFGRHVNADQLDHLHFFVTSNALVVLSSLSALKTFSGSPIECITPPMFPSSWNTYAENYCWSQDTYFVPPETHVETLKTEERAGSRFSYYQWVPFFLIFQAACFRLPSLLWNYLSTQSGIRIREVVERAMDPSNMDEGQRIRNVDLLVRHLKSALRFQRRLTRRNIIVHKTIKLLNLTYAAGFISTMYLFTKVLYLLNVVIQLYLMNKFLETDKYQWYGFGVIRDILNGTRWETSGAFPRVSVCDFTVRQVANIQKYSVQCVLVINIFNEKIFILMWFWYMAVMIMTIYSVFYWTILMGFPCFGRWFVGQNLEMSELKFDSTKQRKQVSRFVNEYLRQDGVFVLRMVTMHAGVIFGTDLVLALWKVFYGIECTPVDNQSEEENEDNNNKKNFLRNRKIPKVKENAYDMENVSKRRKNKDSLKQKHNSDTLETHLMPLSDYKDDEKSDDSRSSKEREEKRFSTEDPHI
ncbi:hypothetical protein QR680_006903 [Steinernema hermaphroditum]|uniref:Innexin n=1 Tax=Steinernema hermaphroditum TaxID=289476 RepID=A0AA39LXV0_9BILA|nr:hypothetical protein QR680_006903 [Steinernema hermaphroditum]